MSGFLRTPDHPAVSQDLRHAGRPRPAAAPTGPRRIRPGESNIYVLKEMQVCCKPAATKAIPAAPVCLADAMGAIIRAVFAYE
ncbi:hypothetical protein [Xylophilus sp.]|uniref:hypothetical protein n=1 Tax=Xylophilus sp. TaxID=2653893 RepID=UPI002D8096E4|nr:hypothetical protein [Xylophilus sp.]